MYHGTLVSVTYDTESSETTVRTIIVTAGYLIFYTKTKLVYN